MCATPPIQTSEVSLNTASTPANFRGGFAGLRCGQGHSAVERGRGVGRVKGHQLHTKPVFGVPLRFLTFPREETGVWVWLT